MINVPAAGVVMSPPMVRRHTFPGRTSPAGIVIDDVFETSAKMVVLKEIVLCATSSGSTGISSKYCRLNC
jgi:hypothetical protein